MEPDAMIFVFWMVSFRPAFSLSSFTLIKRLFSSSSLSAIRGVSYAYLRLLIFPPAILIPACDSSSPAFHMMYSAYKLNKQSDNIQPCHTPALAGGFFTTETPGICGILTHVQNVAFWGKKPSCLALADFCNINIPNKGNFKRQMWHHW